MLVLIYIILNIKYNDASTNLILKNDIITRYTVGGIPAKSKFSKDTTIQSIIIKILGDVKNLPIDTSTPNTRYKVQDLGILSTNPDENTIDLDDFLIRCSNYTGYYGASIGSTITIKDGTYNKKWVIVGFDCEHNKTASDGTPYDNGYGIFMIPTTSFFTYDNGNMSLSNGYMNTGVHKKINNYLQSSFVNNDSILKDHLIKRRMLLSNSANVGSNTTGYEWTVCYGALMSAGQITGTFGVNNTVYDDGEANYKLPYFNFNTWQFGDYSLLRGLRGTSYSNAHSSYYDMPWCVSNGSIMGKDVYNHGNGDKNPGIFPLIMIR